MACKYLKMQCTNTQAKPSETQAVPSGHGNWGRIQNRMAHAMVVRGRVHFGKYVHISTRPEHAKIRMDLAQEHGRGVDPRVAKTGPSTLLFKVPDESPSTKPLQRTTGSPGCAAGTNASGPMAFEPSTQLRPCALCSTMKTHFHLMESFRPEHAYEKRECGRQCAVQKDLCEV